MRQKPYGATDQRFCRGGGCF